MPALKIKFFVSPSTDPYFNLALEDVLLRSHAAASAFKDTLYVLLYQNQPSLILGNFQCLWKEVPIIELKKHHLNIVRRQSGGGTVYHDLGNLNFSFIFNNGIAEKNAFSKYWKAFFESHGIVISSSGRDDFGILKNNEFLKFSGQAFKQTRNANLHHGTLLFDSNLEVLQALCMPNQKVQSKSVNSVVSKVANLNQFINLASLKDLIEDIQSFFGNITGSEIIGKLSDILSQQEISLVELKQAELQSWERIFGNTPKFSMQFDTSLGSFKLEIQKAVIDIIDAEGWSSPSKLCFLEGTALNLVDFERCVASLKPEESRVLAPVLSVLKDQLIIF